MRIRSWLLNPVLLYGVIFGGYIVFPTLSALYFDESSQLFLGSVWDWSVVQKGLFLFLASLVSFYAGYRGSAHIYRYRFIPVPDYKSAQTMARWAFLPLVIFSIGLMGNAYFFGQYEGGDNPGGFYTVSESVRAGVAILYFTIEMLAAFLLIADWNYRGKVRGFTLLAVTLGVIIVAKGMKRLELVTPILALIGFIYLNKSKPLYVPAIVFAFLFVTLSIVGAYRVGASIGFENLLSFVLEANFVVNSLYRVIDLIDNYNYPFTYAIELLAVPVSVIPNIFFPDKHLLIDVGLSWNDRMEISPQGGYYGLAHLYRYGGIVAVVVFSICLGLVLGYFYRRFLRSFNGSRFTSIFYPVIILPFLFHYVRDDVVVAIKLVLQTGILLFLLGQVKSAVRNGLPHARPEPSKDASPRNSPAEVEPDVGAGDRGPVGRLV
jgi:hypothetical protein